jgi:hypothetical protein
LSDAVFGLARLFAKDNPRFDRTRFLHACLPKPSSGYRHE